MYKMIILFEQPINESAFQQQWQLFMGMAEKMPRLRKEVVSRIDNVVFSRDGKVLEGPAQGSLRKLRVEIQEDNSLILFAGEHK